MERRRKRDAGVDELANMTLQSQNTHTARLPFSNPLSPPLVWAFNKLRSESHYGNVFHSKLKAKGKHSAAD
jgi:hypothetical protein